MKKFLIGVLICTSLTMSACSNKLNEISVKDTDSELLKNHKILYNLDVKAYNQSDIQEKLMETWEHEAKSHPKDNMGVILVRSIVNYVDFSKDKQGNFYEKELMENVLNNLIKQNKELKKCDESESKNFKKFPNEKLEESRKLEREAYSIRNKSSELKAFDKDYTEIGKNTLKSMTKTKSLSKELTGEEFLKINYKKIWKESRKKQRKVLEEMKNKIQSMN